MGASKTNQYSINEIKTANIARALAHPARIRILSLLKQELFTRNTDLVKDLQLVKSTINSHLNKLKDADLIELEFHSNCYWIRSKKDVLDRIPSYLEQIN
jgi:DNA-binding transcriptional ArsR family regulator